MINFIKRFHQSIFLQVFREFCDQIGVENIRYAYKFRSSFYTENVTNLTCVVFPIGNDFTVLIVKCNSSAV